MTPFFVGWSSRPPAPLLRFLALTVAAIIVGFGALAFALGVTVDDPGGGDFTGKYRMLVENFSQWQASAGRVQSIDLQYSRQVILNPDSSAGVAVAKAR